MASKYHADNAEMSASMCKLQIGLGGIKAQTVGPAFVLGDAPQVLGGRVEAKDVVVRPGSSKGRCQGAYMSFIRGLLDICFIKHDYKTGHEKLTTMLSQLRSCSIAFP